MKSPYSFLFGLLAAAFTLALPMHLAAKDLADLTAEEIIQKHSNKNVVESEVEFVTIVTQDSEGNTTRHSILFCTQKNEAGYFDYLVRVVLPKKYAGVGLLATQKSEGKIERFFYLPALGKAKRMTGSSSGASQSFLGSNFTYEDLMKETPGNYVYERLPDTKIDGAPCFVIRAKYANLEDGETPKYAYRDLYIEQDQFNILKVNFIAPDSEKPVKTLRAYDYNSVKVDGATMRPLRAEMRDNEADSVSWLTVIRSRFNEKLNPELFTEKGLTSWSDEQKKEILGSLNSDKAQK